MTQNLRNKFLFCICRYLKYYLLKLCLQRHLATKILLQKLQLPNDLSTSYKISIFLKFEWQLLYRLMSSGVFLAGCGKVSQVAEQRAIFTHFSQQLIELLYFRALPKKPRRSYKGETFRVVHNIQFLLKCFTY